MDAPSLLAFFLLPLLLLVHSVSGCPDEFDCGPRGVLGFPFFDSPTSSGKGSSCGLFRVNCSEPDPTIQLGDGGLWFNFAEIPDYETPNGDVHVEIDDQNLHHLLATDRSCDVLDRLSFLNSTSTSFKMSLNHSLPLFTCPLNLPFIPQIQGHWEEYFFNKSLRKCEKIIFLPKNPDRDFPFRLPLPPSCFWLPTEDLPAENLPPEFHKDLFRLVSDQFLLELHLNDYCETCANSGGHCPRDDRVNNCSFKSGATKKLGLILGLAIPGSIILTVISFLTILHRRKLWTHVYSRIISRNTRFDPSSMTDIEGGAVFFGIPVFSYRDLQEATNNFDPFKELGDGGFGIVYRGTLKDGREVAVKRLYEHNYKSIAQFRNEIEILTRLRHKNLVTLYGCTSRHSRELLLVYEYIPNGTVADHLYGDRAKEWPLTWPTRLNIAVETAGALAYLHASEIIHRDVKTNNLLLDNNYCVKVADFGLSRLFPNDTSHISTAPQGTPGYVDPEYHQCYQLTYKSDVYSFGVVLIELISSMPAVDIDRNRHEINLANLAINRIQCGAFEELIDNDLGFESDPSVKRMTIAVAELAFQCLQPERETRPAMEEVLEALKEIQEFEGEGPGEVVLNGGGPPRLGENDDIVLLKKLPPSSPVSVAEKWISGSSASFSSV